MANNLDQLQQMLSNPYSASMKKHIFNILQERYPQHDEIVTRICTSLTKHDIEKFGKLIADIFEVGFIRCVDEHKEQLDKMGVALHVKRPEKKSDPNEVVPIFPPQEKSG